MNMPLRQYTPIMGNFGARTIIKLHQEKKDEYIVLYPACEKSKLFCEMCGTKTFTPKMLDKVRQLGYDIQVVWDKEQKDKWVPDE